VVDVVHPRPGPCEVGGDILACGVSHRPTYRDGGLRRRVPRPARAMGLGQRDPGGGVWTQCRALRFRISLTGARSAAMPRRKRGRPLYCFNRSRRPPMTLTDSPVRPGAGHRRILSPRLWCTSCVHEGRPGRRPAVGLAAGCVYGRAWRNGQQHRCRHRDDTCRCRLRGVVTAAIAGARLSGHRIIAFDNR